MFEGTTDMRLEGHAHTEAASASGTTGKAKKPSTYEDTRKWWINALVFCYVAFGDILNKYAPAQSDLAVIAFAGLAYTVLMHALVLMHSRVVRRILRTGQLGSHLLSLFIAIIPLLWAAASFIILFIAEGDTLDTKRLFEGLFGMIATTVAAMLATAGWNIWKNRDKTEVEDIEGGEIEESSSDVPS